MALDISRIPPVGSRGFDYFRANILPSERAELDAYVASLKNTVTKQPVKTAPIREEIVDFNADPFANSFADDEAGFVRPIDLKPIETTPPPAPRPAAPSLAGAEVTENPLKNYADFLKVQETSGSALSEAAKESGDYSGMSGVDVNVLSRDPQKIDSYYKEAVSDNLVDYIEKNDITPYKMIDGQKVYLNTGNEMANAQLGSEKGGVYIGLGPVGSYSVIHQPKATAAEAFVTNPFVSAFISTFAGPVVMAGLKAAAGVKLTPMDYLAIGAYGLDKLGSFDGVTLTDTEYQKVFKDAQATVAEEVAAGRLIEGSKAASDMIEGIMTAAELGPTVAGVELANIADVLTGETSFLDALGITTPGSTMPVSLPPSDGVIYNLTSDVVDFAQEVAGGSGALGQLTNVIREGYVNQQEQETLAKQEQDALAEKIKEEAEANAKRSC
jgi:hypothetical protein